jgi:ATP-binding cassette subfamily F protein uup
LLLARLFARPANVLVLDEPTNDLDIDTLELLESLLQDFSGTLFLVSHDRAFLENTVTQVIAFEGNGVLTEFGGGYDDWQRFSTQQKQKSSTPPATKYETNGHAPAGAVKKAASNAKISFKEQKELDAIPAQIEALEAEQTEINTQLADAALYQTQPDRVKTLQTRLVEVDGLLEALLARWEALDSK